MRALVLLLLGIVVQKAFCLDVLKIKEPLIDIKAYLPVHQEEKANISSQEPFDDKASFKPVTSRARPGWIQEAIKPNILPINVFVVGDDELSKDWLEAHKDGLKNLKILGLVAHVATEKDLRELESLAGMNLIAGNVDALTELLQVSSYPFIYSGGKLWQ